MIDTIKICLKTSDLGNIPEIIDNGNIKNTFKGKLKNILIRGYKNFDSYNIIIEGSLHKYLVEDNSIDLDFYKIKDAIYKLSEDLGLDLTKGVIRRLDFGANIVIKHDPKLYNLCFYKGYRYTKHLINNGETIEFRKGRISLCFYDKRREQRRNRFRCKKPSISNDKNVIRYEVRLIKLLASTLKVNQSHLILSDLYRKSVYRKIVKLWYKEYKALTKVNFSGICPKHFNKFNQYMYTNGLMAIGSMKVLTLIHAWSDAKKLKDSKLRYLRDSTQKLLSKNQPENLIVRELNKKIRKIKKKSLSSI